MAIYLLLVLLQSGNKLPVHCRRVGRSPRVELILHCYIVGVVGIVGVVICPVRLYPHVGELILGASLVIVDVARLIGDVLLRTVLGRVHPRRAPLTARRLVAAAGDALRCLVVDTLIELPHTTYLAYVDTILHQVGDNLRL